MNKKKITNITAIALFGILVISAAGFHLVTRFFDRQKEKQTKLVLNSVADTFNDKKVSLQWERGEFVDSWNNTIILIHNDKKNGVQFASKGKDCEFGTKDDIRGSIATWRPPPVPKSKIDPEKSMKTRLIEGIKGVFGE